MAPPKGNQFWKLRSKHGRDKLFDSAELMWEAACEYFEWCDENAFIEIDYRGKDADKVELPKMRPYTLHGLCLYLDANTQYLTNFKNSPACTNDFHGVITRIEEVIYTQKFSGAASGFFNANIIARDLGLADKKELSADVRLDEVDYKNLSDEALREIANASRGQSKS
jgi:Xaa-Pro aminopeptidase